MFYLLVFAQDQVSFQGNGGHGESTTIEGTGTQEHPGSHFNFDQVHESSKKKATNSNQVKHSTYDNQAVEPDFQIFLLEYVNHGNVAKNTYESKDKAQYHQGYLKHIERIGF